MMIRRVRPISLVTILALFCLVLAAPTFTRSEGDLAQYLTKINPKFMIGPDEAMKWHQLKDKGGPTYSGSPSWRSYMEFTEKKLKEYGVVDLIKNEWTYNRWFTSEWPDNKNWSLISDGKPVKVSSYGAYSGSTGPKGVTADLVLYNPKKPPQSIEGKIVVFRTAPHPKPPLSDKYKKWFTLNDYEFRGEGKFPPLFTQIPPSQSVAYDVWWQLRQTIMVYKVLAKGKAAGAIVVFNMSPDRLAGLYTFPVMRPYNSPTLYVDRIAGAKVIEDAKQGKKATLTLVAKVEPTKTYQLIGFLPGKDYGTDKDSKILLITHTDGPSISQDNGPLGILGIVEYFSHIPKAQRPRTLMIFLDNRHYMPGMERAFAKQNYFAKQPEAKKSIVGLIATEHLGQKEYRETKNKYGPSGEPEFSFIWTSNDPNLIKAAEKAVKDNKWPRVMVQCVEKPGIHGKPQGVWYGMGKIALKWKLPAYASMGAQGNYWRTAARVDSFDPDLFCKQVATMSQLTGVLMNMKLK